MNILQSMHNHKGNLNVLHHAVYDGDIFKVNWLVKIKPGLLHVKDRYGMTPLHYAVMRSRFAIVRLLIQKGAKLDARDCDGYPPIFYCKHRKIYRWLRANGAKAFDSERTELHRAAFIGNLLAIKANLSLGINAVDGKGLSPLHYAVMGRHRKAIVFLLRKGADPYAVDDYQRNIINYAKRQNHHTPLSRFLKNKIGLSKQHLLATIRPILSILKAKLAVARLQNKKLMILLGELHGDYRLYQIEKMLLAHLSDMGIKRLFVETHKKSTLIQDEYVPMINKRAQRMTIHGVDNHPKREVASLNERNLVIREGVTAVQQDGVMITGLCHLYGLTKAKATRLSRNQFVVVPVNLGACLGKVSSKRTEEKFAYESKKVVQGKRL